MKARSLTIGKEQLTEIVRRLAKSYKLDDGSILVSFKIGDIPTVKDCAQTKKRKREEASNPGFTKRWSKNQHYDIHNQLQLGVPVFSILKSGGIIRNTWLYACIISDAHSLTIYLLYISTTFVRHPFIHYYTCTVIRTFFIVFLIE